MVSQKLYRNTFSGYLQSLSPASYMYRVPVKLKIPQTLYQIKAY